LLMTVANVTPNITVEQLAFLLFIS
jgi:hypothetical protein